MLDLHIIVHIRFFSIIVFSHPVIKCNKYSMVFFCFFFYNHISNTMTNYSQPPSPISVKTLHSGLDNVAIICDLKKTLVKIECLKPFGHPESVQ